MARITVRTTVEQACRNVKQFSPTSRFAIITLRLEPSAVEGIEFNNAVENEGGRLFGAAVEAGVRAFGLEHDVTQVRVTLTRVEWHDVDSSDAAFGQAAKAAMARAMDSHGVPI